MVKICVDFIGIHSCKQWSTCGTISVLYMDFIKWGFLLWKVLKTHPAFCLVFLATFSICLSNLAATERITPRSFKFSNLSITFHVSSVKYSLSSLRSLFLPYFTTWNFVPLNFKLFSLAYSYILSKSSCRFTISPLLNFICSPLYKQSIFLTLEVMFSLISATYIRKNRGSSTVPWATPDTSSMLSDVLPDIATFCFLFIVEL